MKRSKDAGKKVWKSHWLGDYAGPNKIFTLTTLVGVVYFLWVTLLSFARSAATFGLLLFVYSYFNPESFEEMQARALALGLTDILIMLFIFMAWHSLVVKIFYDWRRWKARRRNPLE